MPRPVSFDEVDRKLVLELQHDGRASYAALAESVGMSQAAVRARVQRLLDSGAVQIAAVADPYAFGFSITAMVGVTCTGDLHAVGERLAGIDAVHFVAVTAGRYDCLCEVVCVDTDDLLRLVNDEIRALPGVREVDVITYLKLLKQWQPEFVRALS
ncbi:MAG: Lrp/AsnC family transcriptional regulator, regulator for asnA, asnC and gidA [Acidimicrobiaceae bacterium]|jgi:Lrp/AsnC family transcriptional regulator for asnA, asnC and gidA